MTEVIKWRARSRHPRACSRNILPGLQGLDMLVQIGNAHLNLALVALAHVPEQITPNRHILAAMGGEIHIALNRAGDVGGGILAPVLAGQFAEIGWRNFQRLGSRSGSFAVLAVADRTISVVHLRS